MANMAYARFRNTLADLRDCEEHMEDDDEELGEEEALARRKLIELCAKIAAEYD
jgi:hypothetical protein